MSYKTFIGFLLLSFILTGCGEVVKQMLTISSMEGTYTGYFQQIHVSDDADLEDSSQYVIIDYDLLHELTVTAEDPVTLLIESPLIPTFRAIVLAQGDAVMNLEFVEFVGSSIDDPSDFSAMKIKQIVFLKVDGDWILYIEMFEMLNQDLNRMLRYVSYSPETAQNMSETESIVWINNIFKLASDEQRND